MNLTDILINYNFITIITYDIRNKLHNTILMNDIDNIERLNEIISYKFPFHFILTSIEYEGDYTYEIDTLYNVSYLKNDQPLFTKKKYIKESELDDYNKNLLSISRIIENI